MATVAPPQTHVDDASPQTRCVCGFLHTGPRGTPCLTCQAKHQAVEVVVTPVEQLHGVHTTLVMPETVPAVVPDVVPTVSPPRPTRRACSLCVHPDHATFDAVLQTGTSLRVLQQQYGYATSTWSRHSARCLGLTPRSPLAGQHREEIAAQRAGRICARPGCGIDISHKLRTIRFCSVRCGVLNRMATPEGKAQMQVASRARHANGARKALQETRAHHAVSFVQQVQAHMAALEVVALEQDAAMAMLQAQQARTQRQIAGLRLYLAEEA